jgi:hypothetical protein
MWWKFVGRAACYLSDSAAALVARETAASAVDVVYFVYYVASHHRAVLQYRFVSCSTHHQEGKKLEDPEVGDRFTCPYIRKERHAHLVKLQCDVMLQDLANLQRDD